MATKSRKIYTGDCPEIKSWDLTVAISENNWEYYQMIFEFPATDNGQPVRVYSFPIDRSQARLLGLPALNQR